MSFQLNTHNWDSVPTSLSGKNWECGQQEFSGAFLHSGIMVLRHFSLWLWLGFGALQSKY